MDAYLKGIGDFDAEKALKLCVATANIDDIEAFFISRRDISLYNVTDEYNSGKLVVVKNTGICVR